MAAGTIQPEMGSDAVTGRGRIVTGRSTEAEEIANVDPLIGGTGARGQKEGSVMKGLLRRLRGAVGMGVTWALGWLPLGALIGLGVGVGFDVPVLASTVGRWAAMCGVMGFVGGTIFSSVLRLGEAHGRFDRLSLPRFTAWGALGGLALGGLASLLGILGPGWSNVDWIIIGASTLLGAGSAAGTLALARAADDPSAITDGAGGDDAGLTDAERVELLG